MDFLSDLFTLSNILILISAILAILLASVGRKWKPVVEALIDVPDRYKRALDPNSPGGQDITDEERKEISAEFLDVIVAAIGALGGPIGRLFVWSIKGIRKVF